MEVIIFTMLLIVSQVQLYLLRSSFPRALSSKHDALGATNAPQLFPKPLLCSAYI